MKKTSKTTTAKAATKRVPVPMGVHSHTSRNNPSGQQIALSNNDGADYQPMSVGRRNPTAEDTPMSNVSASTKGSIPDSAYTSGADDNY